MYEWKNMYGKMGGDNVLKINVHFKIYIYVNFTHSDSACPDPTLPGAYVSALVILVSTNITSLL